jgi:hypothetical protein
MKSIVCFSVFIVCFFFSFAQKVNEVKVVEGKVIRHNNFNSKFVNARNVDVWLPENYSNQKQVIVKEENQVTGEVITKSYQLVKHNGIWESTILWVITEKPAVNPIKENKSGTIHTVQ